MSKKVRLRRGILGVESDPKKKILYQFGGEDWPSEDDSSDSDYCAPKSWTVAKPKMNPSTNRLDDSAIEVDSSVGEERSDNSQCSPSDGHESRDSGTEIHISQKNGRRRNNISKPAVQKAAVRKVPEKQHWVVSNGMNSDGVMTLKIKLDGHSPPKGQKRKRNKDPSKETKKPRSKNTARVRFAGSANAVSRTKAAQADIVEGPWGNSLPLELLVRIFKKVIDMEGIFPFINRVQKVCSHWQEASTNRALWENLDLSSGRIKKGNLFLMKLIADRDLSVTKKINLAGWGKDLTPEGVKIISSACTNLASINLNKCIKVTSNCLKVLVNSCPNLSYIDISGIAQQSFSNSATNPMCSLKYVFEKCGSHLTYLNISENVVGNLSPTFKSLAKHCPNLQVLDASNLGSSSSIILPLEELQTGCPRLRVLRLANSHMVFPATPLSEQVKAPGFPDLEELSIAEPDNKLFPCVLRDSDLERVLKISHKLKLLDVRGCHNISVSGLVRLPAWDIQHLYLSKCDATRTPDLELILKKWSHSLKNVDLSWANDSASIDQGIIALASAEESPLEYIDLCGSAVSYSSIQKLLLKCTQLQSLNLQSCRGLPRGIKRLYTGEELISLKECISPPCQEISSSSV